MSDPKLPHGTKYCKCTVCGEYFKSPSSFDAHRVMGICDDQCESVRCKNIKEMAGAGMSINGRGYWIVEKREFRHV